MKICKCVKCGSEFEMPDNFYKMIICENCDPVMNTEEPQNLPKADAYSLLADVRADVKDCIEMYLNNQIGQPFLNKLRNIQDKCCAKRGLG